MASCRLLLAVELHHVLLLAVGLGFGLDEELGLSVGEELATLGLGVSGELDGADLDGKALDDKELDGEAEHSSCSPSRR